jgi:hypothetical protein
MKYRPLPHNSIRLLCLKQAKNSNYESEIFCRLEAASLDSEPIYEALSYTWGDITKTHEVTCDGKSLRVTSNLFSALKSFRLLDCDRIIWIDAICINQEDVEERNEQVGMMKDIYARAYHVVIWLGEETKRDKAAFDLLHQFETSFKKRGYFDYVLSDPSNQTDGFPGMADPAWIALAMLFQRAYFRRIWVIQEILMSRDASFFCGSLSASSDLVVDVARSLHKGGNIGLANTEDSAPGIYSIDMMRDLKSREKRDLLEILIMTRNFLSTDARDKIFGLLGIVTHHQGIDFHEADVVNYNLRSAEVFHQFAIKRLANDKSLVCLANAGVSSEPSSLDIPSWVPDWSHHHDNRRCISFYGSFAASGNSKTISSISTDGRVLTVRGHIIDTVSKVAPGLRKLRPPSNVDEALTTASARYQEYLEAMYAEKIHIQGAEEVAADTFIFPDGQDRGHAIAIAVHCGMLPEWKVQEVPYYKSWEYLRHAANLVTMNEQGQLAMGAIDPTIADVQMQHGAAFTEYLQTAHIYSIGRNFAATAKGYMARVPHGTIVGDVVAILFGGATPFLLRDDGDGFYKLVGEGYVHGLMHGEATGWEGLEEMDFMIR